MTTTTAPTKPTLSHNAARPCASRRLRRGRTLLGCDNGAAIGGNDMNDTMTLSQRADALEQRMSDELDYIVIKSRLYSMADADMGPAPNAGAAMAKNPRARAPMC